jgi:hypothetical protein
MRSEQEKIEAQNRKKKALQDNTVRGITVEEFKKIAKTTDKKIRYINHDYIMPKGKFANRWSVYELLGHELGVDLAQKELMNVWSACMRTIIKVLMGGYNINLGHVCKIDQQLSNYPLIKIYDDEIRVFSRRPILCFKQAEYLKNAMVRKFPLYQDESFIYRNNDEGMIFVDPKDADD